MKNIKLLILLTLLACANLFASTIATITAINGDAQIQRAGQIIKATLGATLQEKDDVVTKENSKVQIIFKDETIISIGKNSHFSIKEYLFEDNQAPVAKFGMISGAMRTITGKIGKIAPDKFSVHAKTATIGIRGTNFTVVIGNNGSFNAFCTFGKINANVNGENNSIKQGYFISISPSGKIEVKEFTPADLKEMKAKSFTTSKKSKGKATKSSNSEGTDTGTGENNEQIDVTTNDTNIVISDSTDDTQQDAIQTSEATKEFKDPGEPRQGLVSMLDSDLFGMIEYYNNPVTFSDSAGKESVTLSGYIFFDIESDEWISALITPTENMYSESFSTTFFQGHHYDESNDESQNITINSSSFVATGDDLVSGDHMSWGTWAMDYTYDDNGDERTREDFGFWNAGDLTPVDVFDALTGTANYSGIYRGINENSDTVNGDVTMEIDFGNDTGTLNIESHSIDLEVDDVIFTDTEQGNDSAHGGFYGPNAESAGGNFYIEDGSAYTKGVFQVKQ